jgi:hypothetical protein
MLVCHWKMRAYHHLCRRFRRRVPKHKLLPLLLRLGRHLQSPSTTLPPLSPRLLQFLSRNRLNIPRQHQISGIVLTVSHVVFSTGAPPPVLVTPPMLRISYWFEIDSHLNLTSTAVVGPAYTYYYVKPCTSLCHGYSKLCISHLIDNPHHS